MMTGKLISTESAVWTHIVCPFQWKVCFDVGHLPALDKSKGDEILLSGWIVYDCLADFEAR